jgi:hypothetical protein
MLVLDKIGAPRQSVDCLFCLFFAQMIFSDVFASSEKIEKLAGTSSAGSPTALVLCMPLI